MAATHATNDDRQGWARELLSWWHHYNSTYVRGVLRPPVLRIAAGTSQLGTWDAQTRTLSIAAAHIEQSPWPRVLDTLRHEMAHQLADEALGAAGETAHGPTFQRACQLLHADPRAREVAGGADAADGATVDAAITRVMDRVHKLLSLAGSPNRHEAEVALGKARELLLRYNLGHPAASPAASGSPQFGVCWLGPTKGRHALWEQLLGALLAEFFFVDVIWVHSYDPRRLKQGTILEVAGTRSNLDMAEYVHGYLTHVAAGLWNEYRRSQGLPGNRERMRFYAGVVRGFAAKLRDQDGELRSKHALVWRGDPALQRWVRFRHPHLRGGSVGSTTATQAYRDGIEAGRAVTLRRPLGSSGTGDGVAGLLKG